MGMKWPSGGSTHGSRLKIFALDGLVENSTVFFFFITRKKREHDD